MCDDDEDERLLDLLRLRQIRTEVSERIRHLQNPPFWVPRHEQISMYKSSFLFELVYDEAMEAIKEVCRVPVYATSDDDLSDSSSDSSDSSA